MNKSIKNFGEREKQPKWVRLIMELLEEEEDE